MLSLPHQETTSSIVLVSRFNIQTVWPPGAKRDRPGRLTMFGSGTIKLKERAVGLFAGSHPPKVTTC